MGASSSVLPPPPLPQIKSSGDYSSSLAHRWAKTLISDSLEGVEELLQLPQPPLNQPNQIFESFLHFLPLHCACFLGLSEIVEVLLSAGFSPLDTDSLGRNSFHFCILSPFSFEFLSDNSENPIESESKVDFKEHGFCVCWLRRFCEERSPLPSLPNYNSSLSLPSIDSYQSLWIDFWTNLLSEILDIKFELCTCSCLTEIQPYCPCIIRKNERKNFEKTEKDFFNILINNLKSKKKNILKNYDINSSNYLTTNNTVYCMLLLLYSSLTSKKQNIQPNARTKLTIDTSLYLKHDAYGLAPIHYISLFNYSYMYSIILRNVFDLKNIFLDNSSDLNKNEKLNWYNNLEIENFQTCPSLKSQDFNMPKLLKKILLNFQENILEFENDTSKIKMSKHRKYVKRPLPQTSYLEFNYFLTNIYSSIDKKKESFCDILIRLSCNDIINFISGFSNSLTIAQNIIKVKEDRIDQTRMMKVWEKFFENAMKFALGEPLNSVPLTERDYSYTEYDQITWEEEKENEDQFNIGEWVYYENEDGDEWIWVTADGRIWNATYGWYLNDGWHLVIDETNNSSYYCFLPTGYSVWDPPEGWDEMVQTTWNGWILCVEEFNIDHKFWYNENTYESIWVE